MTTIVRHRKTGNEYILLSVNGEENKTNPSRFINELFNSSQKKTEISCSATVCDVRGNLFLAYIDDLVVVEIDGQKPSDILPEAEYSEPEYDSVEDNSYRQPISDFDDEDFNDEELEEKKVIITPNPESSTYSQDRSNESDFGEDEREWI